MSIDLSTMPKLGFGLMRLPEKDGVIDHEQVCKMVDSYMNAGMNYFDTAYVYHGGKSEVAAREALVKRYPRESFMIATKLPAWEIKRYEDIDRIFNEQLERAGVDYFDFYLLHSIEDGSNYDTYENGGSSASGEYIGKTLVNYFGYDKSVRNEFREYYKDEAWENLVYDELAAGRPVLYSGKVENGGGHQFICDGYEDGLFLINWGWGNLYDGIPVERKHKKTDP